MSETDWLEESDIESLLRPFGPRKIDKRKLRLLGCALCRRLRSPTGGQRRRIEVAEKYADGLVKAVELREAESDALDLLDQQSWGADLAMCDTHYARKDATAAVRMLLMNNCTVECITRIAAVVRTAAPAILKEQTVHASLVRDVFANPYRKAKTKFSLDWLAWRNRIIPSLAQAAYDDRDLPAGHMKADKLAILADALEEAGCTSAGILSHLRGPGPHVRGCWVVDLLLGKE